MTLSVIIPVYNAGAYLLPCVQSLCQLAVEKEILVIDDGSTDGAVAELEALRLPLRIVHQPNRGVAAARNLGLSMATGEWVWFCDADDMVLPARMPDRWPEALLLLLPFAWEERGDIQRLEPHDGDVPYNLWRCWFRRELVMTQGIRFTEGRRYAEDQEFILRYLLATSGASDVPPTQVVPGPMYHYTVRPSGAMMKRGTRRRQLGDIRRVTWGFLTAALRTRQLGRRWVLQELKRLCKTWLVTALR